MTRTSAPEFAFGLLLATAAWATVTILMGPRSLWSSEAAGWAQAIGTIVAVLGAAWIAGWQDRKTRQRNAEQQIKKAKSVAGCFVPILKIIEYDVRHLKHLTLEAQNGMPVDVLKRAGYQFREIPPSVSFVLQNADLLPGDAIVSVPHFLSLRELLANDIVTVLRHNELEHHFDLARHDAAAH